MMAHSYKGIICSNENWQDIVTSNNASRIYSRNFDQKKLDTEAHMLMSLISIYLSTYLPTYLPTSYLLICLYWMFGSHQNPYVKILTLHVMVIGGETFEGMIRSWGQRPQDRIYALMKETPESSLSHFPVRGHSKNCP